MRGQFEIMDSNLKEEKKKSWGMSPGFIFTIEVLALLYLGFVVYMIYM